MRRYSIAKHSKYEKKKKTKFAPSIYWITKLTYNNYNTMWSLRCNTQLTSIRIPAVWCVLSTEFCAWHIIVLLWNSLFAFSFIMDLAVNLLLSAVGWASYSTPAVKTFSEPSIHVICLVNKYTKCYTQDEWRCCAVVCVCWLVCFIGGARATVVLCTQQPMSLFSFLSLSLFLLCWPSSRMIRAFQIC